MTIYIIFTFLIVSFFAFSISVAEQLEKGLFLLIGFSLILIAGFRLPGPDYANYIDIYNGTRTKSIEPAIKMISSILKYIFNEPISLFIVFAALGVSLKMIAIRQLTELWFFSLAIYISYYFIYHEMIQIRAGIVSGLLLLCIKPIYERNFKLFALYLFLGLTFHISALLLIPLWFLKGLRLNKIVYVGIIMFAYLLAVTNLNISFVVSYIPIERVQLLYEGYIRTTQKGIHADELNIFGTLQLLRVAICFFLIYFIGQIANYNKFAPLILKIYVISVALYVYLSDLPILAFRASQLVGIVEIIAVPLIIYAFTEKSKKIAIIIPITIGCILIGLTLFYRKLLL